MEVIRRLFKVNKVILEKGWRLDSMFLFLTYSIKI